MSDEIKSNENNEPLRTAVVAIIGRPSAGKSTFLNTACQEPVSIVSPIPQTTRNAIKGIVNTSFGQLIFIDTPGYHDSDKKLNLRLRNVTETQLFSCIIHVQYFYVWIFKSDILCLCFARFTLQHFLKIYRKRLLLQSTKLIYLQAGLCQSASL